MTDNLMKSKSEQMRSTTIAAKMKKRTRMTLRKERLRELTRISLSPVVGEY